MTSGQPSSEPSAQPPRAVVLVRNGPLKGERVTIAPGAALRIGRTEQADFVFAADRQMSALHCLLTWDGQTCRLQDLGSLKGTRLSGEAVAAADVADGSYLQVGDTLLSVYIEGAIPPRRRRKPTPEQLAFREQALTTLRQEAENAASGAARPQVSSTTEPWALHAVLDAARDDRILELLPRSGEAFQSLYDGIQGQALDEVAPYLVRLSADSRLLRDLVMEGWGDAWGVYLTWPGPTKELRRHLRRLLLVLDVETTQKMYFRYYDPRVLRAFLPLCNVAQRAELVGEIGCLLVEGDAGQVLRFEGEGAPPS